jgi:amidase
VAPRTIPPFELEEATIADLQKVMQEGRLTSKAIAEQYLRRIEDVDKSGPAVNAVIEVNPDALAIAEALDEERRTKGPRGPLHGVPVLLKDNIGTSDRMMTTAGSLALTGSKPARDSFVAERLRAAGAVILGKTNLSEWANFRSSHSTSGWSGRGGLTKNPYALDRNPCGSSSGSGVAVSSNLCAVAVGTETDGSIVCPSNANSIVGLKPTLGLVSRAGIIPIAHSQDTAGPMARTVADAAILLGALAGEDPRDAVTQGSRGKSSTDYTRFLDATGLRGARIGVARNFFGFSETVDALINACLDEMRRQGAELVDPANVEKVDELGGPEFEVLLYEFKADLNAYLAALGSGASARTLEDLIAFNEKNRDREMPHFGQDIFLKAQEKGPLTEKPYRKALEKCRRLSRGKGIDRVLREHRLDAIVAPTGGPPWMTDLVNGDHYLGGSSTPAAVAGYPSLTVPAGYVNGLPVGISFFGAAYSEPVLIRLAYAFERGARFRTPPRFLPSVDFGG